ncbi:hypothetical protein F2Q70_00003991 [Brassica cretica]|uniref:Uncharacterized protein n=1 Tax=Brassica cretica TaxID=69181 RepID=A0A3N6QE98_BRACR|nr:hypothetical protein F2Q70_00003991 [Brassica cretica]KAF3562278.1 hypothetical protein DY000_02015921 [Brassica cretica]
MASGLRVCRAKDFFKGTTSKLPSPKENMPYKNLTLQTYGSLQQKDPPVGLSYQLKNPCVRSES